jgi:hypothetical protein
MQKILFVYVFKYKKNTNKSLCSVQFIQYTTQLNF